MIKQLEETFFAPLDAESRKTLQEHS